MVFVFMICIFTGLVSFPCGSPEHTGPSFVKLMSQNGFLMPHGGPYNSAIVTSIDLYTLEKLAYANNLPDKYIKTNNESLSVVIKAIK